MFFSIFTIYQGTKCRSINWWKTLCNFKQARPALGGPVRSTSQRSERVNATNRRICFERITYFTKSLKKILQLTSWAMFFSSKQSLRSENWWKTLCKFLWRVRRKGATVIKGGLLQIMQWSFLILNFSDFSKYKQFPDKMRLFLYYPPDLWYY